MKKKMDELEAIKSCKRMDGMLRRRRVSRSPLSSS